MKLLIKCFSNGDLCYEQDFNHASFYEVPFVQIGLKLNIIDVPEGYYANNIAGLRLRRSFKANEEQKKIIIESSKLTEEQKLILTIAMLKNYSVVGNGAVKELISKFGGIKIGNIEDINSWFEELEMNEIDKIEFVELED